LDLRSLLVISLATLPFAASADALIEGVIRGQAQVFLKDGRIEGCGVAVLGMNAFESLNETASQFHGSFTIYLDGTAAVKGLAEADVRAAYVLDLRNINRKAKYVELESFWFKAPGKSATTPLGGKTIAGDSPMSKLYRADPITVMGLFEPIMDAQPIQIGVKRKADRIAKVYFGQVKMEEAELNQLAECLREFGEALELQVKKSTR
jgi:hypothetical protein